MASTSQIVKSSPDQNALPFSTKLAFGFGAVGDSAFHGLFNTFITIYYNQAIGLSNTLIGIAIMLALIGDAITDPVVGIMSDNWRSRHGRRHPFLWVAPVPLAIAIFCIFNPPDMFVQDVEGPSQWGLFIWLSVWTILSRGFLTLYNVPHLALGGELSKDQLQRSQLFSANTVFGYAAGATFGFVAWSFFFAGERVRESDGQFFAGVMLDLFVHLPFKAVPGQLDADVLIRMGVTAGPLIGIAAIISLLIYSRYSLNRERHQQIIAELEQNQSVTVNTTITER